MDVNEWGYSSLNFWRKTYLLFLWLSVTAIIAAMVYGGVTRNEFSTGILISVIVAIYGLWIHLAVSKRKLLQIHVLTGLTLLIGFNIVGAVLLFWIGRITKHEINS